MNAHSHFNLTSASFAFDIILVLLGVIMAIAATKIPSIGAIGKTVRSVVIGALILGFAHMIETGLDALLHIPTVLNELVHRCIILVGFAFLYFGIKGLADSLSSLRAAQAKR